MAKATTHSPSPHHLVAHPATAVNLAQVDVDLNTTGPLNARSGLLGTLSRGMLQEFLESQEELSEILKGVFGSAFQEMVQSLSGEERLVSARMPQGLRHAEPADRWTWLIHCPALVGKQETARKALRKALKNSEFLNWCAARDVKWSGISEEVKG